MRKLKIYSEEKLKRNFDKIPFKKVRAMIGFYEPVEDKWRVTTIDGFYEAKTQFEAEVIASLEEIKALLIRKERG